MQWLAKNGVALAAVLITLGGVYVTSKVQVAQMDTRIRSLEHLSSDTEEFRRKIVVLMEQQELLRGEYDRQRPAIEALNTSIHELTLTLSGFSGDVVHLKDQLNDIRDQLKKIRDKK